MKASSIDAAIKIIPDIFDALGKYLKNAGNDSLKSVQENKGTIGLIFNIFGKPMIDKYLQNSKKNKLANFGIQAYLEASLIQIGKSLVSNFDELQAEYSVDGLLIKFENSINIELTKARKQEWVLFFQPQYHPIISEVIAIVEKFLLELNLSIEEINQFKKNFYEEIEGQIKETFGHDLYIKHINEIKQFLLKENETKLLFDNIRLSKIGFKESENLHYEDTYAEWKAVASLSLNNDQEYFNLDETLKHEKKLSKIETLIDLYFNTTPESHLEKVLFIIADFGKGKSVFLRHYTSLHARKFLSTSNGYFPIYFNLRNYKDYSEDHSLGVIGNFLEIKYGIRITDEYFAKRNYLFLVDSLDECGELNSENINKVIDSVKKIQHIDPVLYKKNKIIITSRPFDDGLKKHLERHSPYRQINEKGRPIDLFISLYGFKKEQFNKWLSKSLEQINHLENVEAEGLNKNIIDSIVKKRKIDIYASLIERQIISYSELRRPIFAYMIFQLLLNAINFDKSGKIGVYLSFLNLLTKEAKYLHDLEYNINLREQFEARNILHATAAIWLYNKSVHKKSEIKKADIYRVLDGEVLYQDDSTVLKKYKEQGNNDIEFLSHSYFGDNNNTLHFQHQSFAEILIAEYYLKVLLKFSFEGYDIQTRLKLSLGDPTIQTMNFFKELVLLLKDSVEDSDTVLEKRRLLFPLLASLATIKNNKHLYSNHLFYTWFNTIEFDHNNSDIPLDALKNWPINRSALNKLADLCRQNILSPNNLSLLTGEFKSSLYGKEILLTSNTAKSENIDKLIALVCGNLTYNDSNKWFNSTFEEPSILFDLFKKNYSQNLPNWCFDFFVGINLAENKKPISLIGINLAGINFSNSILNGIEFDRSILNRAKFINCKISNCDFSMTNLNNADFRGTDIEHYSRFALSSINQGLLFPYELAEIDHNRNHDTEFSFMIGILVNYGSKKIFVASNVEEDTLRLFVRIIRQGYLDKIWSKEEIIRSLVFEDSSDLLILERIFDEEVQPN